MERIKPMNRLLQGDVGSGKTIVSVIAAYKAAKSGYQVCNNGSNSNFSRAAYARVYKSFRSVWNKM